MRWDDCLDYKVKKVKENPEQAKSLYELALKRIKSINKRKNDEYSQFLIESYYETIKELVSSLLSIHGLKSYSHECLISFIKVYYPNYLDESQLLFLDRMRKLRSDIQYRGREVADDYLDRNLSTIEDIIDILKSIVNKELF